MITLFELPVEGLDNKKRMSFENYGAQLFITIEEMGVYLIPTVSVGFDHETCQLWRAGHKCNQTYQYLARNKTPLKNSLIMNEEKEITFSFSG